MPLQTSPAPPRIEWAAIRDDRAAARHAAIVELTGWMIPLDPQTTHADYFLLAAVEPCCGGCVPRDPLSCVEVDARHAMPLETGPVCVRGRLMRLHDDPAGWRYRLVDAHAMQPAKVQHDAATPTSRRAFLAAGAALGLAACAPGRFARYTDPGKPDNDAAASTPEAASVAAPPPVWQPAADAVTVDMHSHAGHVIVSRDPRIGVNRPLTPVSAPMRAGGMNVICLAIVTDTVVTRVSFDRKRFKAWRNPNPGELYALSQEEFARAKRLVEREQMQVVTSAAALSAPASGSTGPRVIIASEGADFLEGQIDRVDEAWTLHHLRHLQLTHYRVNELGDIQTEAPVHGGLTDFGADVVRRCNRLGIVVDVAHGTYDLVKRAAAVTTKPLVLSHTALSLHPRDRSRLISPDHARAVAETGGVIGIWPSAGSFRDIPGMAHGFRRMADIVGVEHVGLGTDMFGFISPPVLRNYEQLPELGNALLAAGFQAPEVDLLLGGNYGRVFAASLA
ncbi:dipeptidase [Paraburkholderia acidipaludis]|uniref:dipeptidase n=1 Tax=Paraburkholderia acidipaludis TaxID=660537 RepID=UPI001C3F1864|nr:membrane dipeptidase [Paraburkholderia acidipaludis]